MNLLNKILRDKRQEVERQKKIKPLAGIKAALSRKPALRAFAFFKSLKEAEGVAAIAEIKRKSPSKGVLCRRFEPEKIAREYERAGASALSVLTDKKYFGGSAGVLKRVRAATSLPILRKDFIVDEYQIYEARLLGADAILLIASALTAVRMKRFKKTADLLGMDILFEVHDEKEMDKILPIEPRIIGVNNRNLKTFEVSLSAAERLSRRIPKAALFVSESGIASPDDVRRVRSAGAKAILVGEALMRDKKPGQALKKLIGLSHGSR